MIISYYRKKSLVTLADKDLVVIGMPQSLHFNDEDLEKRDAKEFMEQLIGERHMDSPMIKERFNHLERQIILTWRQENSYIKAKELYPLVDNRLVPDMAFMIGPLIQTDVWTNKRRKVDILFGLRIDKESRFSELRNKENLTSILKMSPETANLSFELADWYDKEKYYNKSVRDPPGPEFKYKVSANQSHTISISLS